MTVALKAVPLNDVVSTANKWLLERPISDYCPNGLQVEGRHQVKKIVSGVTASQALVDEAIKRGADLLLVHHGYFWKGEEPSIVGMKKNRLKALLQNDVSLLAYHLPLDVHAEFGNNARLAARLGITIDGPLDPCERPSVGLIGHFKEPITVSALSSLIDVELGRTPLVIEGGDSQLITTIGWCTGGAQGYIEKAVAAQVDAYISGEISEPTAHIARECGIHYFAAGHHATERYGVMALGELLANEFEIEHEFVDIDNPA